jgi:hypothetical protein
MPHFLQAPDQGKTQNLKALVEGQLLRRPDGREGAPPLNDVMRAIFTTISRFAIAT